MDTKEIQKFREHYSTLPDGTLLELLKGGEAGLIEGAYELARDEAIKRGLTNSDSTITKPEQDKRNDLDAKNKDVLIIKGLALSGLLLLILGYFVSFLVIPAVILLLVASLFNTLRWQDKILKWIFRKD